MINAKDLSFSIGSKKIIQNIQFEIKEGEVVALVGHNGAGKTTLFHLMLGLKFQNKGQLTIAGIPALEVKAREKISFVPERPYLNPSDTSVEMLQFFGKLSGKFKEDSALRNRIAEVLKEVNLAEMGGQGVEKRKLKTFSKGMLQRSLIAQALLSDPEILILDEPMSGLDPEGREWVKNLITKLKSQGKTILFSTHVLEDAQLLADKVMMLNQGQIEFFGTPVEYSTRPIMQNASSRTEVKS